MAMNKFFGNIGFAETTEIKPGVWEEHILSRPYYGEILQDTRRYQQNNQVNNDISINLRMSIISDPYVVENSHLIRYVEYNGVKWAVNSLEPSYPRMILNVGGVYNEQ